jgi:ubiquinone/menaquinone biosynthesis C-methylase UbiE
MLKEKIAEFIGNQFAKRQYNIIIKNISWKNPKNILDVGGSSGILANKIIKMFPLCEYTLIDIDKEAMKKGKKKNPKIKFLFGNIEKTHFKKNEFDLVICKDVLHLKS